MTTRLIQTPIRHKVNRRTRARRLKRMPPGKHDRMLQHGRTPRIAHPSAGTGLPATAGERHVTSACLVMHAPSGTLIRVPPLNVGPNTSLPNLDSSQTWKLRQSAKNRRHRNTGYCWREARNECTLGDNCPFMHVNQGSSPERWPEYRPDQPGRSIPTEMTICQRLQYP